MRSREAVRVGLTSTVLVGGAVAMATGVALATPSSGVSGAFIANGVISERLHIKSHPKESTRAMVQQLTVQAGGTTGWHTHAGPVVVVVRAGTFTLRSAEGGTCVVQTYGPGSAFVDPGRGFVHEGRNDGAETVELTATYLIPDGGMPRLDVPEGPVECSD